MKNYDWRIHNHYYANMVKNVESTIQGMNKTSEMGLIARESVIINDAGWMMIIII